MNSRLIDDLNETNIPKRTLVKKFAYFYSQNGTIVSGTKMSHIYNLYSLSNEMSTTILNHLIMYENELKEYLAKCLEKITASDSVGDIICELNNRGSSFAVDLQKIINKNSGINTLGLCNLLSFGQVRIMIQDFSLLKEFGTFTKFTNTTKKNLRILNLFRNAIAHGWALAPNLKDEFGNRYKLVTVFKILSDRFKGFIQNIENSLVNFNFFKINIDQGEFLKFLKVQGLFNLKDAKNICDITSLYNFFCGYNYKKILSDNWKTAAELFSLFGKVRFKSIYKKEYSGEVIESKKIKIKWYKKYLEHKKIVSGLAKHELIIEIVLSYSQNNKIRKTVINSIIETSFIDMHRVKRICNAFKIDIIKEVHDIETHREIVYNNLLLNGYIKHENNYFVNRKLIVLKKTKYPPFYKEVKHLVRTNNYGRSQKAVYINSKLVPLHVLAANLFVPNPKGYEFVTVKNMKFMDFVISDLKWIEYSAKPRKLKK